MGRIAPQRLARLPRTPPGCCDAVGAAVARRPTRGLPRRTRPGGCRCRRWRGRSRWRARSGTAAGCAQRPGVQTEPRARSRRIRQTRCAARCAAVGVCHGAGGRCRTPGCRSVLQYPGVAGHAAELHAVRRVALQKLPASERHRVFGGEGGRGGSTHTHTHTHTHGHKAFANGQARQADMAHGCVPCASTPTPIPPLPHARSKQPAASSPQQAARSKQPAASSPQQAARRKQPAASSPQQADRTLRMKSRASTDTWAGNLRSTVTMRR